MALRGIMPFQVPDDEPDMWLVDHHGYTYLYEIEAARRGVELWCYSPLMQADLSGEVRYRLGMFMWAHPAVRGFLLWAYMHDREFYITDDWRWNNDKRGEVFNHAISTPAGPMPAKTLCEFKEATVDYRILAHLEQEVCAARGFEFQWSFARWLQSQRWRCYEEGWSSAGGGPGEREGHKDPWKRTRRYPHEYRIGGPEGARVVAIEMLRDIRKWKGAQ